MWRGIRAVRSLAGSKGRKRSCLGKSVFRSLHRPNRSQYGKTKPLKNVFKDVQFRLFPFFFRSWHRPHFLRHRKTKKNLVIGDFVKLWSETILFFTFLYIQYLPFNILKLSELDALKLQYLHAFSINFIIVTFKIFVFFIFHFSF